MTNNALALIEPKNIAQYFEPNGLDQIIERIRQEGSGFVGDISTEKGRKEIASLAYKVAKSKTTLDGMGKDLVSGRKQEIKAIDAERKRAWDALEAIQHEVRAPLTEWENREKARIATHETAIADLALTSASLESQTVEALERIIARAANIYGCRDWQEFAIRAKQTFDQVTSNLQAKLEARRQYEADQAELARLRREEADRQQRERDERLQAEAAAKAKAEAEEQARQQAEAAAARVRERQEQAELERQRIQREKEEAEERATKAEADRKAAEEQAERDRIAAAEQAQRDAEAAAKVERDRIAAEQRAVAEAQARREANKRHRAKIDGEAAAAIYKAGISAGDISNASVKAIVEAISRGQVPRLKIVY